MTTDLDQATGVRPQPKRDRWGRYMVVPEGGGKAQAMTRATTWAKAIDDQEGLIGWKARVAMLGVGRRPDLYALCCAAKTDAELKAYVDEAADAGGAGFGRNVGSALHTFTERVDLGEDVTVPDQWRADIDAYQQAIAAAGLTPVPHLVERVCVLPDLGVAGTLDRVYADRDGVLAIGDVKTGQTLDFAALSISVQLALYANAATLYDVATDTHEPMPAVRRDVAYVVHVPSGQGRAEVLEVPVDAGWEYAQLCGQVRAARARGKRKGELLRPVAAVTAPDPFAGLPAPGHATTNGDHVAAPAVPTAPVSSRREWVVRRVEQVKTAGHAHELVALWPKGVPGTATDHPHTDGELDLVDEALAVVEARHGLPFDPDPAAVADSARRLEEHRRAQVERIRVAAPPTAVDAEEGAALTDDEYAALQTEVAAAGPDAQALAHAWLGEAIKAGVSFSVAARSTTRRRAIARAALALADLCEGKASEADLAAAVLYMAANTGAAPVGVLLGQLTQAQAEKAVELADRACDMELTYVNDRPRFVEPTERVAS